MQGFSKARFSVVVNHQAINIGAGKPIPIKN